jgi:predicted lipid-binding transport protein (Tim44 family)
MRRFSLTCLCLIMALAFNLVPSESKARVANGLSVGSRGSQTYVAPRATASAPYGAAPIQRSMTSPGGFFGAQNFGATTYGRTYGLRPGNAFTSGLLGGLLGAGLGGLLFGGGFFGGMHGGPGVLGVLLQMLLLYMIATWAYRRFAGGLVGAGAGLYGRVLYPGVQRMPGVARPGMFGGGRRGRPITLLPADYDAFTELLTCIQAAWSAHDVTALRSMATPEMTTIFAEQLSEQARSGVRNQVSDVHLQKGELSEAWSEGTREYATVSMQFSMVDVTLDSVGRVLDGSLTERVTITEFWTFMRAPRARWVLSAIQQAA